MIRYFLIFLLFPITIYSQITENWTRTSLNESPEWIGESEMFHINSDLNCLELNASEESSSAFLFTASEAIIDAEWNFSVTLDFNPSSSNYCVVYLCCNQCEVSTSLEGYYIKIGDTSDNVSLWKQKNSESVKLINGLEKILDLSGFKLDVKVKRDDKGNWSLYTSLNNGEFIMEGQVFDDDILTSAFYGMFCKYTSTRRDKFHYGPIQVTGEPYTDQVPPRIISHNLSKGKNLELMMSEDVNPDLLNVKLNESIVDLENVTYEGDIIDIIFKEKVNNSSKGSIAISGIKDLSGNAQNDTILYYSYFKPNRYDIVISEILIDPDPVVSLPECEFVEIYNQTEHEINLFQYRIIINGKSTIFPEYILKSHEYAIIVSDSKVNYYENNNVISVGSLPSLNNSEGEIIIDNDENNISDAIKYPFVNLSSDFKEDGGWSLEKIDVSNQDLSSNNWDYSLDLNGGSPGYRNSNQMANEDNSNPFIECISYNDEKSFTIHFSEAIDTSSLKASGFEIDKNSIDKIEIDSIFFSNATIYMNQSLGEGMNNSISIHDDKIIDLNNNNLYNDYLWKVGVPEEIDSFDLCINEVLFNPLPDEDDFIEIYNRSDKIIFLDDIYLANISNDSPEKLYSINSNHQLIFPGEYWVFSKDAAALSIQYDIVKQQVLQCDLPWLNDDAGNIAIVDRNGHIIDLFEYNEGMHYELLNSQEGVSLERLNVNSPTNNSNNWHSASTEAGYATPTYINSQLYPENQIVQDKWIWLEEETLSPNSDGEKDYLIVNYKMPDVGYSATIRIYNRNGVPVQTLCENSLLSTEGFWQWNGIQSNHIKAPMGIYIVYAEAFSTEGDVIQEKLICVLTDGVPK